MTPNTMMPNTMISNASPPTRLAPTPLPPVSRTKPDRFGPVQTIAWQEAERAGITYAQIIGDQRTRPLARARHYAMWRAARETAASLVAIGRVFGNRDHSTVLYAIRTVDRRIAQQKLGCL